MKCEICHNADAQTVLRRKKKDGTEEELYVCKSCAAASKKKRKSAAGKDPDTVVLNSGDEKPPPFVEDLLKATLGFVKGIAEAHDKAEGKLKDVCPTCGKKREDFHNDNLLGCPDCWKAFAPDIRERLASTQSGVKHAGRAPESAPRINLCAQLERKLKEAVRRQQFEKAAEIRRRLEELGGRPPAPPPPEPPR